MLVLSRREDEKLIIGEGENKVIITVLEIRHGRIRLGITAPQGTNIRRAEVQSKEDVNDRTDVG